MSLGNDPLHMVPRKTQWNQFIGYYLPISLEDRSGPYHKEWDLFHPRLYTHQEPARIAPYFHFCTCTLDMTGKYSIPQSMLPFLLNQHLFHFFWKSTNQVDKETFLRLHNSDAADRAHKLLHYSQHKSHQYKWRRRCQLEECTLLFDKEFLSPQSIRFRAGKFGSRSSRNLDNIGFPGKVDIHLDLEEIITLLAW